MPSIRRVAAGRLGRALTGPAGALVLLFLLLPCSTAAQGWRSQGGDDPRRALPGFDDAGWRQVSLPATWIEQGYQGFDGVIWYRQWVPLAGDTRLAAAQGRLALRLGPMVYGGCEVYAGGRRIGRSAGWPDLLAAPRAEVFRIPADAVGPEGRLLLALRVHRLGWASDRRTDGGPVDDIVELGFAQALADRNRVEWIQNLAAELPIALLAALFAVAGLEHLLLFGRRRQQIEHLWFGLLALAFAVNTLASTYWIYELTARFDRAVRLSDGSGLLATALAVQFLWTFFARPIPRWLRAWQIADLAAAALIAVVPARLVLESQTVRLVSLVPLLVAAVLLVARQAWRGQDEARTIAWGGLALVAIETLELVRQLLATAAAPWWLPRFALSGFAFAAILIAMGLALSNRFRRVHDELDRLRLRLEEEVRERTRDLETATDKALAASRVKSEFLANISHEIRTPMNGVLGMAELLEGTPLSPEQREYVGAIAVSGQALLTLINDILDFSKMESRKLTLESVPFELAALVAESLEMMVAAAAKKRLTLTSEIASGTPAALTGDRDRVRQVLLNLLSNAVKFTAQGEVRLALSARPLAEGRAEIHFAVSDTGIGIADGDRDRLFTAFHQIDASATRRYGGAGLGLAISRQLVELMGGEIWVESTVGRGATFHFTLAGEAGPMPAAADVTVPPGAALPAPVLRVLLVEDQPVNQIVLLAMLQKLGHRADLASDGAQAVEAEAEHAYDVILMDVQMPVLDGLEATRRIRQKAPGGHRPWVIALTAHAMDGDEARCLAAGMDVYLSKPVRLAELERALAAAPQPAVRTAAP